MQIINNAKDLFVLTSPSLIFYDNNNFSSTTVRQELFQRSLTLKDTNLDMGSQQQNISSLNSSKEGLLIIAAKAEQENGNLKNNNCNYSKSPRSVLSDLEASFCSQTNRSRFFFKKFCFNVYFI